MVIKYSAAHVRLVFFRVRRYQETKVVLRCCCYCCYDAAETSFFLDDAFRRVLLKLLWHHVFCWRYYNIGDSLQTSNLGFICKTYSSTAVLITSMLPTVSQWTQIITTRAFISRCHPFPLPCIEGLDVVAYSLFLAWNVALAYWLSRRETSVCLYGDQ